MNISNQSANQLIASAQLFLTKNTETLEIESLDKLKSILNYLDWQYYVKDNPILADQEYDYLFRLLKDFEIKHPTLVTGDSPTQRIAKGLSASFETVAHLVPMLSLENSYNAEDLKEWDKKCKEILGVDSLEYTVEPKYDGAGISLIFENNNLKRAATRGDGVQGDDITINGKQIKSIPLSASFLNKNVQTIELRGEVIIKKEVFAAINQRREAEGLSIFANPRNAASGSLRMLNPKEVANRGLHAVLYHVSYHNNKDETIADNEVLASHYQALEWLDNLGFSTPHKDMILTDSIDKVIDFCLDYEQKRDNLPFEIDGMVVKVNAIALQDKLGQTSHHPRWAIAYKFKARQATSILEKVEFQVGRTGNIGPVAKITPVSIGGATIGSISLFNEDVIREKDLMIGDTVLVERAGDVIPYIVKSIPELRNGTEQPIEFPINCPVCNDALVKPEGEAAWRCVNVNCNAQLVERLIHFSSKNAMDIRSLGEANVKRFFELGIINNIKDIYQLDFTKIEGLENFGLKSIENLKNAIEHSKEQALHRLIFGLGIRFVGETTAKTLAKAVNDLREFEHWNIEKLCTLEDVGPKVAQSIVQFFKNKDNRLLLDGLARLGVNLQATKNKNSEEGVFLGKTFLFTGTLHQLKRKAAEEIVEQLGGKILSGISSNLDYLIVGEAAGSKLEKAKKMPSIRILEEQEFINILTETGISI
ncbi:MAG TPA: NAD-dependent DNA ligase LigA [Edaphocola sp.]|nr:NAD-dependent DNA ligase LigA [Edaphocola sp.]